MFNWLKPNLQLPPTPLKPNPKPMLRLIRVYESEVGLGTFGVLVDEDGEVVCRTAELNWRENRPNISCIPSGTYDCVRIYSPSHGDCFSVADVPGRTHILFHTGNWAGRSGISGSLSNTDGCILPGGEVRRVRDFKSGITQVGVTGSGDTMRLLLAKYPKGFTLVVEEV